MSKYDLSIVIPGIRKANWLNVYNSLQTAVGKYSCELILAGPIKPQTELLTQPNVKYIKSYGCPTRCTQIATNICEGELFTWGSDDGVFLENGLELAIDLWHQQDDEKNEIILKYTEGPNPYQPDMTASGLGYWHAWFHDALKLPGIPKDYKTAPVGMLQLEYFKKLGGLDCRFENNNMCVLDLSFRIQHDGGQLYLPEKLISHHGWSPQGIMVDAYFDSDKPLFDSMYTNPDILNERSVLDYNNWIYNSEPVWSRRFSEPGVKIQAS